MVDFASNGRTRKTTLTLRKIFLIFILAVTDRAESLLQDTLDPEAIEAHVEVLDLTVGLIRSIRERRRLSNLKKLKYALQLMKVSYVGETGWLSDFSLLSFRIFGLFFLCFQLLSLFPVKRIFVFNLSFEDNL